VKDLRVCEMYLGDVGHGGVGERHCAKKESLEEEDEEEGEGEEL
jgi:hypothetical protein